MRDILPESRSSRRTGAIYSTQGTLIPIYCANCGKPWGMVPEKHITFAFALCDPCAEHGLGDMAHVYQEPDAVFWERVANAQLEEEGHILSADELAKKLEDPSSTFAKLAEEWRAYALK